MLRGAVDGGGDVLTMNLEEVNKVRSQLALPARTTIPKSGFFSSSDTIKVVKIMSYAAKYEVTHKCMFKNVHFCQLICIFDQKLIFYIIPQQKPQENIHIQRKRK